MKNNLIHHLPNIYIKGELGRAQLNSPEAKMEVALKKLLK